MTVYNRKIQNKKQNLLNGALNSGLSSSNTSIGKNQKRKNSLQNQDKDIKKGLQFHKSKPMDKYIPLNKLPVNNRFFRQREILHKSLPLDLSKMALRVFSYMSLHINSHNNKYTTSIEEIATYFKMSVRVVKYAIAELKEVGVLKTKRNGFMVPNTYSFNFDMFKESSPNPPTSTLGQTVCTQDKKDIISKRNKSYNTYQKTYSDKKEEFKIENWIPTGKAYEHGEQKLGKNYLLIIHHAEEMRQYCQNNPSLDGKPWTKQSMNYFFFIWLKKSLSLRDRFYNLIPYGKRAKYNENLKKRGNMDIPEYTDRPPVKKRDTTARIWHEGAYITLEERNMLLYKDLPPKDLAKEAELDMVIEQQLKRLGIRV